MDPLSLIDSLELKEREIIAAYGAGGKTTLLYRLAQELAGLEKKVVLTTTTKIFRPAEIPCVITPELEKALTDIKRLLSKHDLIALGSSLLAGDKLKGIEPSWVESILKSGAVPYLLVEADGAAGKPIKGYASYEPALPPASSLIFPVLGVDALGKAANSELVHRLGLFLEITGAEEGERLNVEHFTRCLIHMLNLGHGLSPQARIIPIINKVDDLRQETPLLKQLAQSFAGFLQECQCQCQGTAPKLPADRMLFTAARQKAALKFIFNLSKGDLSPYISCVILAAGSSRRMGRDKLSLKIRGETLLEHSLKNVLASRVDEVIIVSRPGSVLPAQSFHDPRVKTATNEHYHQGLSTSLKTGIVAANPLAQGIIFTLADQPFIPAEVYDNLIASYIHKLNLLTLPVYKGKRGNPVLFDRRTWPRLMELEGDEGGRQLFPFIPEKEVCSVETRSPGIFIDIDTPGDFQKYEH